MKKTKSVLEAIIDNQNDEIKKLKEYITQQPDKQREDIRDILIDFASRNDKYNTTNIRNVDVPAYLERKRKDHAIFVDDFLKTRI